MNQLAPLLLPVSPGYAQGSPLQHEGSPLQHEGSPAYAPDSPLYTPGNGTPCEDAPECEGTPLEEPASRESMKIAENRAMKRDLKRGRENPFEINLSEVGVDELWQFITRTHRASDWLERAENLMVQLEPLRRAILCRSILDGVDRMCEFMADPTRADLEASLVLIDLFKFATRQWLALPDEFIKRPRLA